MLEKWRTLLPGQKIGFFFLALCLIIFALVLTKAVGGTVTEKTDGKLPSAQWQETMGAQQAPR